MFVRAVKFARCPSYICGTEVSRLGAPKAKFGQGQNFVRFSNKEPFAKQRSCLSFYFLLQPGWRDGAENKLESLAIGFQSTETSLSGKLYFLFFLFLFYWRSSSFLSQASPPRSSAGRMIVQLRTIGGLLRRYLCTQECSRRYQEVFSNFDRACTFPYHSLWDVLKLATLFSLSLSHFFFFFFLHPTSYAFFFSTTCHYGMTKFR